MSDSIPTEADAVKGTIVSRRNFIGTTASGLVATAVSGSHATEETPEKETGSDKPKPKLIRWGFVGTGRIASSMAKTLQLTTAGQLVASSSRTLEKAEAFASKYGAKKAFDSWQKMIESDDIDAIYVATPTSVREEICVAAAKAGKHVLGEKPFASLPSVKRITEACQKNNVAFMDGTHFSHHPRTTTLRGKLDTMVGKRRRVNSVFQFLIRDKSNIRMQPKLEPMGCVGDVGWYNMRAIVEYIDSGAKLERVTAYIKRDVDTNAVIEATGLVAFVDGSTSSFSCGFDSGAFRSEVRMDGPMGSLDIEKFHGQDKDNSASYRHQSKRDRKKAIDQVVRVESSLPGSALMFEDFAAQVQDKALRDHWKSVSIRTQELLDLVWANAIENEQL